MNSGISNETQALLNKVVEDRDFDFKETTKGLKTDQIVAFANSGGGVILLGVKDNTSIIVGCGGTRPSEIDEIKRLINAKAASCHPPIPVDIQVENIDAGKPIYRINIPAATDLCCTAEGIYKKREDGRNVFISPAEVKARVLEVEAEEFTRRLENAAKHIENKVQRLETLVEELQVKIDETKEAADKARAVTQDAADVAERFNRDFWDYRGY